MATETQNRLTLYLDAETKILSGQSVQFGERRLQLPDLEWVQKQIALLQAQVGREDAMTRGSGGRFSQADFGGRF